jgi:hypothetical protein
VTRYNLVLLLLPDGQHVSDYMVLRHMMLGPARDIDVHIIAAGAEVSQKAWDKLAEQPTLFFSPGGVDIPASARGTRLISKRITKQAEYQLLKAAGVPVPELTPVQVDTKLDEAAWGPWTVLKPDDGFQGRGVRLTRTRDVKWVEPSSWPKGDPRRGHNMMAQRYIDTGPRSVSHRVFTVLGQAIYSVTSTAMQDSPALPDPAGSEPFDVPIASNGGPRTMAMNYSRDIIDLAVATHRKFPDMPTMGVDVIRDHKTGELWILEVNPGGFTWHISSTYGIGHQRDHGLDYYGQFNALGTIAKALIETTRARAT